MYRRPFAPALRLRQTRRGRWAGSKVAASDIYAAEVVADSPLHYWRMGAASGDEPDEVGSVDLVVSGATRNVAGALTVGDDGAASFDGTNDYARTGVIDFATVAITIECWFKPVAYNSSDDDLLWEFPGSAWHSIQNSFIADLNNSTGGAEANTVSLGHKGEGGSAMRVTFPQSEMPIDAWHHLVVVHKSPAAATGEILVYVDGAAVTTTTREAGPNPAGGFNTVDLDSNNLLSFMSRQGASLYAAGSLDEVAFYNTELSAARVLVHYEARLGGGADLTPPIPNVTSVDVTKISRVSGKDVATLIFGAAEAFVEYDLRLVPTAESNRAAGTRIETATVASRTSHTVTITDDELVAATASEGTNLLKVFVRDVAENWSV